MPPTREPPTWRKIESALIELLREEGLDLEQYRGDTTIRFSQGLDGYTIDIGEFARALADRLA